MSIYNEAETLKQVKCLNKDCNKVMPFRYKIYDGKISCRCRVCKRTTVQIFLKGNLLLATLLLLESNINNKGGGILPIAL